MLSLLERLALPLAFAIIVVAPALGVALTGRNLAADHNTPLEIAGATLWLLRSATLAVVLLALLVIVVRATNPMAAPMGPAELGLLVAFGAFFGTNVVVPALLGAVPGIEKSYFYVLALFLALFMSRSAGIGSVLDAVKWSILVFVLLSFAYAVAWPDAALRFYKAELRLPLVPFRFWGLGTSPNSVGPTALTLLLIAIVRPFPSRLLQAVGLTAAIVTLLLAQSQTTWISSLLIVPTLLLYRRRLARHGGVGWRLSPALAVMLVGLALGAAVLASAALLNGPPVRVGATPGLGGGGADLMTGRGAIWQVAVDTLLAHPLFGYGLLAWGTDFRAAIAMPYAFHAHNQLLQSLSVAGLVGGAGLVIYVVVLIRASLETASVTGGLAPALLTLALIGSISEAPLDLAPPLLGDTMRHALLFGLIMAGYARQARGHRARASGAYRGADAAVAGSRRRGPLIA